jgi:serine/threonine protein kinase
MAIVYLAYDHKHGRDVALKVMNTDQFAGVGVERFIREIRTTAGLTHPHILPIHDSDECDGILYYTMPYIEGKTLRSRMLRDGRLTVEEAVRVARQVASALSYAHAHGIVHRDIKPENILLGRDDHVWVADFGVAAAIASATNDRLTASGATVGSPIYISPEQIGSSARVDGRADVYSLGCVTYETLAGNPPFVGPGLQPLLHQHLAVEAPDLRTLRPDVPLHIAEVVRRALAKDANARPQTAESFSQALAGDPLPSRPRRLSVPLPVPPKWAWAAAGVVLLLAIVTATLDLPLVRRFGTPSLDSTAYVILPFRHEFVGDSVLHEQQLLYDAMGRWTGISAVDLLQVRDQLDRRSRRTVSITDARSITKSLRAGRFIQGMTSRVGGDLRISALLYDVDHARRPLASKTVRVSPGTSVEQAIVSLIDSLLIGSTQFKAADHYGVGTTSLPALHAYARGWQALYEWELERVDSLFSQALRYDGAYAKAALWLAHVRGWTTNEPAEWQRLVELAAAGSASLSPLEQRFALAVRALAKGDYPSACAAYRAATLDDARSFAAWYSLGDCYRRDDIVVRDAAAPSRWAFRSSYQHAIDAYLEAFRLLPSIHRLFRGDGHSLLRRRFFTDDVMIRLGRTQPGAQSTFFARPAWSGDSLAFVPQSAALGAGPAGDPTAANHAAVLQQRKLLEKLARNWVTAFPNSASAAEVHAAALDLLGDETALDELRRARALAESEEHRLNLMATEVFLQLKLSAPSDVPGLVRALHLADSVLESKRPTQLSAAVAVLTGRALLAARLATAHPRLLATDLSRSVVANGNALLAFAAVGGPPDSISEARKRTEDAIERYVEPEGRTAAWQSTVGRAIPLAFPELRAVDVPPQFYGVDPLVDAVVALQRGDSMRVKQLIGSVAGTRPGATFDVIFEETRLAHQVGMHREALEAQRVALSGLRTRPTVELMDLPKTGGLARSFAYYSRLFAEAGYLNESRLWATAFVILWCHADEGSSTTIRQVSSLVDRDLLKQRQLDCRSS